MDWAVFLLVMALLPAQFLLSNFYTPKDISAEGRQWSDGHGLLLKLNDAWTSLVSSSSGDAVADNSGGRAKQSDGGRHTTPNTIVVDPKEYFAQSKMPRRDRSNVKFRVGQVIRHKRHGYRGVIIGWDKKPKAPEAWFVQMGVSRDRREAPFYSVLVDTRDRGPNPQTTYVWQGNIEVVGREGRDKASISHPEKGRYLRAYEPDYGAYVARDWLRRRYPRD